MQHDELARHRRKFGKHFTSTAAFQAHLLPSLLPVLHDHAWVDMFAGEGNLIFPMLDMVHASERVDFFRERVFMFDIDPAAVAACIDAAVARGIPRNQAASNITVRDTLRDYPDHLLDLTWPVYHVTNPPYLYIGYIVKTPGARSHLAYFTGRNEGLQDLYQVAMLNDLHHGIAKALYIIPSNFLFGNSVSNKVRDDFLGSYTIESAVIFESQIFEHTGTNVVACFFHRKDRKRHEPLAFAASIIGVQESKRDFTLDPAHHYKAGGDFEAFVSRCKATTPVRVHYYLRQAEIDAAPGDVTLSLLDANVYKGNAYATLHPRVDAATARRVKESVLWVRTVDTGGMDGRVGLNVIKESFGVDGILVTKATYRTHPIQIFFEPPLTVEEQFLLRAYFNLVLEHFRSSTGSEFMTTYKWSGAEYTRKYMGLSQARKIIETFPLLDLDDAARAGFSNLVAGKDGAALVAFVVSLAARHRQSI